MIFLYTAIFLTSERKDSFLSLLNISGLQFVSSQNERHLFDWNISHFSPIFYWLFNYFFDLIASIIWFCYILAAYCICYLIFIGSPNDSSKSSSVLEFGTAWDLRVQFYPLAIIIALPTLPFVYLITKIFKSDILVCFIILLFRFSILFSSLSLVWISSYIFNGYHSFG